MFKWKIFSLLFFFSLLLPACLNHHVGAYDYVFSQSLTHFQQQVDGLLITTQQELQQHQHDTRQFQKSYNKIIVSLDSLMTQANAIQDNEITIQELQTVKSSLEDFYQLYITNKLSLSGIKIIKATLDGQFLAIFKLEFAKKSLVNR